MKKQFYAFIIAILMTGVYATASDFSVPIYKEQGGAHMVVGSGGALDVESGGEIDIESGGALKLAGTAITATAAELNANAGATAGTVVASKAVVVDANKDVGDFRNLDAVNIDAGVSGTSGSVDIYPTTASSGKLSISASDSSGDTTTSITNASQAGARTYTIPDAGSSTTFVMGAGAATIAGTKTFSSIIETSAGVGAIVADKCTAVEYGDGAIHQTVLTLTLTGAHDLDLADGDHGTGIKIYDMPEGRVYILGVTIDASVAHNGAFNASANDVFNVSAGTVVGADDNDLTGTEVDLIPKTTLDTESGATSPLDFETALAAAAVFDGTTSAKEVYINVACTDASNSGATTYAITGTMTITWINLGDY